MKGTKRQRQHAVFPFMTSLFSTLAQLVMLASLCWAELMKKTKRQWRHACLSLYDFFICYTLAQPTPELVMPASVCWPVLFLTDMGPPLSPYREKKFNHICTFWRMYSKNNIFLSMKVRLRILRKKGPCFVNIGKIRNYFNSWYMTLVGPCSHCPWYLYTETIHKPS